MAASVARHLAQYDIGQTVVIAEAACVALEAMEGTDATIIRAGELMKSAARGWRLDAQPQADRGESSQAEPGHAL